MGYSTPLPRITWGDSERHLRHGSNAGALDAADDRQRLKKTITQFNALADLAVQLNERPR